MLQTTSPHGFTPPLLQGQNVLILGLGQSGLAMARWCLREGADVQLVDDRPPSIEEGTTPSAQAWRIRARSELEALAQATGSSFTLASRPFAADLIEGTDLAAVFKSPGLSPRQVQAVWQAAQVRGLWLGTELSLFNHALRALKERKGYAPKLLAVTGTNGKTTVTSLTGRLVARAGKTVAVAGNIGPTLLDTLSDALQAHPLPQVWVLELSSFQLDGVLDFEPTAATVLNLTQDHLDWHENLAAYQAAKENIYGMGMGMGLGCAGNDEAPASLRAQSAKSALYKAHTAVHVVGHVPTTVDQYGLEDINGVRWLVRAVPRTQSLEDYQAERLARFVQQRAKLHKAKAPALSATDAKKALASKEDEDPLLQRLLPAQALKILGTHNQLNALHALALATRAGCALAPMLHALRDYAGEPHRLACVAVVREVQYIDDSKGTNVGATVAALTSLGGERRLHVILGGDGKGQDFAPLVPPLLRYAKTIALIGRDAPAIAAALASAQPAQPQWQPKVVHCSTLPEAVTWCASKAKSGEAVLLSPACASLDMFQDYKHRAQVFIDAVLDLQRRAGEVT